MSILDRLPVLRRRRRSERRYSLDDWLGWVQSFGYGGNVYSTGVQQTLSGDVTEAPSGGFPNQSVSFATNPVVFACMELRAHVFSAVRFQWQQMSAGRPTKLFGTSALQLLETPWPGGTTQDLLIRMIQDADLSGACYQTTDTDFARLGGDGGQRIVRMRPDWVEALMEPRVIRGGQVGFRKLGYLYTEGGAHSGNEPAVFGPDEVSCFSPIPDPLANWRGMSWLTPLIREIQADALMTAHRSKYFENGATPNMIITYPPEVKLDRIKQVKALLDSEHQGVSNAYKRLHLGGGADVTVVGSDLKQIDFRQVQGAGETRIAAAAGTPPVLVGLSEGLQGSSLNAGNYQQSRRRMADITAHPLWANAAGSLLPILPKPPGGARLWYDARDVPFLREDAKEAAEIKMIRAQTMRTWIDAGYTPDSVREAMLADDEDLLVHSGLFSVQLQPLGAPLKDLPALPAGKAT